MNSRCMYMAIICCLMLLAFGCGGDLNSNASLTLRVGVLPDQHKSELLKKYSPLVAHLQEKTKLKVELIFPDSYSELLEMFHDKRVNLAYFGGATYVKANHDDKAIPLVMRDIDARFTSYFIVSANNISTSLKDFEGKRFSFGSKLSTSGHFMPRHYLKEKDIQAESFFSQVNYSGAHDKTANLVRDGKVDIGSVNSNVINSMFESGRLHKKDVRVLWETPPYSDYVWAIQSDVSETIRDQIRWIFLDLRSTNPTDKSILDALGTKGFLPATNSDFSSLKNIMNSIDQLPRL